MVKRLCAAVAALCLSGCATASFSPPSVNLANEMMNRGSNRSFSQSCRPFERIVSTSVNGKTEKVPVPLTRTASGAQRLIDNFIFMYRCRAHSAANGRQIFEVPALITGVGTAAATAFGAGADVAIAGGTATALLGGGNAYYAPKLKADIYDSSLDALLCIKTEAVGVDPLTIKKIGDVENAKSLSFSDSSTGVPINTAEQYYELVMASLLSVERVTAQRLSNVGTFDPAGVIAEIKALTIEAEEKTDDAKKTAPGQAAELTSTNNVASAAIPDVVAALGSTGTAAVTAQVQQTLIGLAALQPRLQQCVVRAKI